MTGFTTLLNSTSSGSCGVLVDTSICSLVLMPFKDSIKPESFVELELVSCGMGPAIKGYNFKETSKQTTDIITR